MDSAVQVGGGVVGFSLARLLNTKVAFIQENPMIGGGAKLVGGIILSGMIKNNIASSILLGVALEGGHQILANQWPQWGIGRINRIATIDLNKVHKVNGIEQKQYAEHTMVQ